jgi:hypothetical protein
MHPGMENIHRSNPKKPLKSKEEVEASIARGNDSFTKLAYDLGISYDRAYDCTMRYGLGGKIKRDSRFNDEEVFQHISKLYQHLRKTKEAKDIFYKDFVYVSGKVITASVVNRWAKTNCKEFLESRRKVNRVQR